VDRSSLACLVDLVVLLPSSEFALVYEMVEAVLLTAMEQISCIVMNSIDNCDLICRISLKILKNLIFVLQRFDWSIRCILLHNKLR
jgi:hypothetical protein